MEEKTILGENKKEEAGDFTVEKIDNLGNTIEDGWIPYLLQEIDMKDETHVYIRIVGNHIEIGAAQVNFIR